MPHYNSYDSFKTKKSLDKKQRAKDKSFKKSSEVNNFIINDASNYGVIVEVRYNDAYVLYNDEIVIAKLRKDLNMVCNQVLFPGDKVIISFSDSNYVISNLVKRTSLLSRSKKDSTRLSDNNLVKNIAANIDLAVIVVSAHEPPLHPKFIDRYLMILENSNIPCIICLNKCDLITLEEEKILDIYRNINIHVIETSTYKNIGIDDLKKYLYGKQAIFVGNSGVGKSSLTNALMNDNEIKTGNVSDKSGRGRHTTTSSKYYIWDDNSSIIDTPGIRSLDVSSFLPMEIQDYFPEINKYRDRCKYSDCLHYNEPYDSCIVKEAVYSNLIDKDRYESYLRIMDDIQGKEEKDNIIKDIFSR